MQNNQTFNELREGIIKSLNTNIMNYVPQNTPKKPPFFSTQNPLFWGLLTVIFAFTSFISFVQIGSYRADKNDLNTFWTIAGIVTGVLAVLFFYKVTATSGGKADKLD